MTLALRIGPDAISSYKRLAYTPWHALAEFVDNSTQAYFDNQEALDRAFAAEADGLEVAIVYERDADLLRISDNSIGMSLFDLEHALHVARPPCNTAGRSKYGMGLKTAACWLGNEWRVTTKKLGETVEHHATVRVDEVAAGRADLGYRAVDGKPPERHYTVIEVQQLNRPFHGRTIGKIREYLSSMYREDFRRKRLTLSWNGDALEWQELDGRLLRDLDGATYQREFQFEVGGRRVRGWVGILDRGSRAEAGFSIIHCGRVVRGWPDSWRPQSLYGQLQGSNDLVNQRLVGEIHLDAFEVSHTKDDILWFGDEEERVEAGLREHCGDYRERARDRRKGEDDSRGPSETETTVAVDELKRELETPEMVDTIRLEVVPPPEVVDEQVKVITESVATLEATFSASVGPVVVRGYLKSDLSPHDPYVAIDSAKPEEVLVIINQSHPHWKQLKGSDGVLNYLRHCVYDGLAEWAARRKSASLVPNTIKMLKDQMLRIPFELEIGPTFE